MKIRLDTSVFGKTKWFEYAIRFVFGGLITAIAGVIARDFGPAIGGLFLAFPAIFPASATLIEKHEKQKKEKHGLDGAKRGRQAASLDAAGSAVCSSVGGYQLEKIGVQLFERVEGDHFTVLGLPLLPLLAFLRREGSLAA